MSRINQLVQAFENPIQLDNGMGVAAVVCGMLALAPAAAKAAPSVEQPLKLGADEFVMPTTSPLRGFMLGKLGISVGMPESRSVAAGSKIPVAEKAANKHCAAQATKRPSVLSFELKKGMKSTYVAKYAVKALDAHCNNMGTRVDVYSLMSQPGGDGSYMTIQRKTLKTSNAVSDSHEQRFGPNWCKNGDVEHAVRVRQRMQTTWKSKFGMALSKTKVYYTKPRTTCEDDVKK